MALTLCTGIGDVRSRLVRLIPEDGDEAKAIRQFFNHRLPKSYAPARAEWLDLVEATHPLWAGISSPKRELIRSFLNCINLEIVKRLRPTSRFDFSGASIGNLFLTGYVFRPLQHICTDSHLALVYSLDLSKPPYISSPAFATSPQQYPFFQY